MFNRKGIMVSFIAKFMLVYFVLAVIPLDFYHHHNLSQPLKQKNATFSVNHTERSASLSSYCLICNLHFNKKYDTSVFSFKIALLAKLIYRSFGLIHFSHQLSIRDITSRGPPSLV
ncbi:hypothetical protein RYH73_15890 [Olivibacter sp. CPCC 100613]|uniref:hypothetical protein n=1 Tax=Olivibacter sp. CPCC 100613 TaxID=3079931 RepID=UPI002FFA5680